MLKRESYDPILVRCPGCNRLFQTNEPMVSEFAHEVAKMVLEKECPQHVRWAEITENTQ